MKEKNYTLYIVQKSKTIHHNVAKTTCPNITQSSTLDKFNLIQAICDSNPHPPSLCIISGIW